jgi:hypothetical protein
MKCETFSQARNTSNLRDVFASDPSYVLPPFPQLHHVTYFFKTTLSKFCMSFLFPQCFLHIQLNLFLLFLTHQIVGVVFLFLIVTLLGFHSD